MKFDAFSQVGRTIDAMSAIGRRALTLKHGDIEGLKLRYELVLSGLKMEGVPSEVLLLFADRLDIRECGCWHWSGERAKHKYARLHPGAAWATSENALAHRFSLAMFTGVRVPFGMVVDHLCPDRSCVAPHHLQITTFKENVQLGASRPHSKENCSPSYCPPSGTLTKTTEPADKYMQRALDTFMVLKSLLKSPVDDERKLFSFAAHVNLLGDIPKVQRGAVGNCWLWEGAMANGYGRVTTKQVKGVTRTAHKWLYINCVKDIDEGLTLDHMCEVRNCVRPSHLQLLTNAENTALADNSVSSINAKKTHCKYGHDLNGDNVRIVKKANGTHRICLPCKERAARESYARKKNKTQGPSRIEGFCRNGHEYTEENTRISPNGGRICRRCAADRANRERQNKLDAGLNYKHPRRNA